MQEGLTLSETWPLPAQLLSLNITEALCIYQPVLVMAARSSGNVMWRGSCLLPGRVAAVCSRGAGSVSSASEPLSSLQDKPRTLEDLPRVTLWELLYRMTFQGFHNRMHELQVWGRETHGWSDPNLKMLHAFCVKSLIKTLLRLPGWPVTGGIRVFEWCCIIENMSLVAETIAAYQSTEARFPPCRITFWEVNSVYCH